MQKKFVWIFCELAAKGCKKGKQSLEMEEQIKQMVSDVLKLTQDITEKGCSELVSYLFAKEGVSVIRCVKKTDNN